MDILCKGEGLTGTARGLQPTTRVQRGGEEGAAAGGGEAGTAQNAREHSHLVQCGPLFPRSGGMGQRAPLYPCTETEDSSEAQE